MFVGLIVLIVLMALCAILGTIYTYIYFTRINPLRNRKFIAGSGGQPGSEETGGAATHLFLFR